MRRAEKGGVVSLSTICSRASMAPRGSASLSSLSFACFIRRAIFCGASVSTSTRRLRMSSNAGASPSSS